MAGLKKAVMYYRYYKYMKKLKANGHEKTFENYCILKMSPATGKLSAEDTRN